MKFLTTILLLLIPITGITCQCLKPQKTLLRNLKNYLNYDPSVSTKLVQWNETVDCCRWPGVTCDADGRVSGLDLSSEGISEGINNESSILFKLEFLQSLNLADSYLGGVEFPVGFGQLKSLRYLNLSSSGFSGRRIASDVSNLTRLVVLDLSMAFNWPMDLDRFEGFIRKFDRLQELYLDGVNVSAQGPVWCHAVSNSLPNLRVLSMRSAYLTGPLDPSLIKLRSLSIIRLDGNTFDSTFPDFFADFTNLRVLSLSSCGLSGTNPEKLFRIKSLEMVDLSNNDLGGSLPEFSSDGSLHTPQLRYTMFSGNLSETLGNVQTLLSLDLRSCAFSGMIPNSIRNLTKLQYLDLSGNRFIGPVPSFAFLRNLSVVNLRGNGLTGRILDTAWTGLDNLNSLDLATNSLGGELPMSLFTLPSLAYLDLSNNSFSGSIKDVATGLLSPLYSLDLSINELEGSVPKFLSELRNLWDLDLSRNKFNGSVELTDFKMLAGLVNLDLSYSNLSVLVQEDADIASMFPKLNSLMLASCRLQRIPLLKNQTTIMMLDLSDNRLQGEIPNWIWELGNGMIRFLNLSHNEFTHLQEPYNMRSVYLDYLIQQSNLLRGAIPIPLASVAYLDVRFMFL